VNDPIGTDHIRRDNLGIVHVDSPAALDDGHLLTIESLHHLRVLQVARANAARNHVELKDVLQILDVLRVQERIERGLREYCKRIIRRREDRERASSRQRADEVSKVDC